MAAGWWLSTDDEIECAKGEIIAWKSPSNNVAEYFGLIRALETALDRGHTSLSMNMDSLLVVQQVLGHWQCKNQILLELLQYVRCLADQFSFFTIRHTLRGGNTVADALCNAAFDGVCGNNKIWLGTVDINIAKQEIQWSKEKWKSEDFLTNWNERWSMVMQELCSIGPMLRNRYIPDMPEFLPFTGNEFNPKIIAESFPSPKSTWTYAIEPSALLEMMILAKEAQVPWDTERFKLLVPTVNQHGVKVLPYPHLDARFTTVWQAMTDEVHLYGDIKAL